MEPNETIRTDRVGSDACAACASALTVTSRVSLFANPNADEKNPTMPLPAGSASDSAVSTMESATKNPINSELLNSSSLAASSDSLAKTSATEKTKSDDSIDKAALAGLAPRNLSAVLGASLNDMTGQLMSNDQIRQASYEAYQFTRENHTPPLWIRRLVLAHNAPTRRKTDKIEKPVRKRASARAPVDSFAVIFGSTLKSIFDFVGIHPSKGAQICALRRTLQFLTPAAAALASVSGIDRPYLAAGLCAHHVAPKQRKLISENIEAQNARSYLGRNGLKDVAVGATAAILISHWLLLSEATTVPQITSISASLYNLITSIDYTLTNWPVYAAPNRLQMEMLNCARCAERRAIGRCRAIAITAIRTAKANALLPADSLKLQLKSMLKAAWPRGMQCDCTTHEAACEMLATNRASFQHGEMLPPLPVNILPLSALPSATWLNSGAGGSSSSSASSFDTASSAGSTDSGPGVALSHADALALSGLTGFAI